MHLDFIFIYCAKYYTAAISYRITENIRGYYSLVYLFGRNSWRNIFVLYFISYVGYGSSYTQWISGGSDWIFPGGFIKSE